ncbi:TetR/AcrR family transcriptional regulator [Actinoplanes awajinensis]|uniref:TetR family transcriptional regulator n=1 Tax=Actinoplanes awajinensis subsp. mycoplanecinus TaxID=135947 RepID=A0A117MLS3_9ACTN|nr:TetR/AcrR family transcriptional regulator [Actinoplanes awajinensis]KUL24384.1 TetR family transcriptional regulator [Actinoplanes awajinensis subsp. mycoplanecinus]
MSRQSEREERRLRIAGAVCALADESGMDGVTLRDVAVRADVSMGAVQRCFRTKDEMLLFALAHIGEQVTARVRAGLTGVPAEGAAAPAPGGPTSGTPAPAAGGSAPAVDALARAAAEIALLGDAHRTEARIWLAFVARAAVSPALAEVLRGNYAQLEDVFTRLISAASDAPGARAEARALLALVDGLTTHVLVGHLGPADAAQVLQAHLDRIAAC